MRQSFFPESDLIRINKTITFTGAANLGAVGAVPIWTVTGEVLIALIAGRCTVSLASAGGGNLALGVTGATTLLIAATVATTITSTNNIWVSTTATATGIAAPATVKDIVIDANIIGTVDTGDVTSGAIEFTAYYLPLSTGSGIA